MPVRFSIKALRWSFLALFMGGMIGTAHVLWIRELIAFRGRTISPSEFTAKVFSTIGINKVPMFRRITVYPPSTLNVAGAPLQRVQYVTGEMYAKLPRVPYVYKPFTLYVDIPLDSGTFPNKLPEGVLLSSVNDYLSSGQRRIGTVEWQYAWWMKPSLLIYFWIGINLAAIGVVVPNLIRLLARFNRRRLGKAPIAQSVPPQETFAETLCSKELNDSPTERADSVGQKVEAQGPPALKGIQDDPPPIQAEGTVKEFDGEFYPVATSSPHVPPTRS